MKPQDLWKLDYCTPAHWPNDMTPPQGDWDREVEPGSAEEKIFMMERVPPMGFTQLFSQIGRGVNAFVDEIQKAFTPVVEVVENITTQFGPTLLKLEKLQEEELTKNGQHLIKSQKPGVTLPVRIVNSGPPERRKLK